MKIKVCDTIMGGGKSQGCINYMNQHPDDKFIYITPYLKETERIQAECPALHFVTPGNYTQFNGRKISHIEQLVLEGRNISTTHAAFRYFTNEMLEKIKEYEYTLIMDEVIDIMRHGDFYYNDVETLVRANLVELDETTKTYRYIGDDDFIKGEGHVVEICKLACCNNLYLCSDDSMKKPYYYFLITMDFVKAFNEVIVLTYLFKGSELYYLCQALNIEIEYIGVERVDFGTGFMLSETGDYLPEYVSRIKDLIHIYKDPDESEYVFGRPKKKLNVLLDFDGKLPIEKEFHLTHTFYENVKKNGKVIKQVRLNQHNYFKRMLEDHGGTTDLCQWSVYKNAKEKVKSHGLQNKFVPLNARATNEFSDRRYLSYLCDLRLQPGKIKYYREFGIAFDQDAYALSTMIQWIWRSRIRNGEEIWIYIPAKRMRDLLENWMDSLTNGV